MRNKILVMLMLLAVPGVGTAQEAPRAISAYPTGEGDPDDITCRPPMPLPSSRLMGPQVCRTNRVWAQYRKDGMDVAADGVHDISARNKAACHTEGGGGANGTTMARVSSNMVCE